MIIFSGAIVGFRYFEYRSKAFSSKFAKAPEIKMRADRKKETAVRIKVFFIRSEINKIFLLPIS